MRGQAVWILACFCLPPARGMGQDRSAPATGPTAAWPAEIVAITGTVQTRETPEKPWVKGHVGMKLGEKAELRAGPRSSVKLKQAGGREMEWSRLGTIQVAELDGRSKNDRGIHYGRVRYDIEAAGGGTAWPVQVVEVSGTLIETRTDQNARWELVKVGMRLDPGAFVRVGVREKLILRDARGQEALIERLAAGKVSELWEAGRVRRQEELHGGPLWQGKYAVPARGGS